MTNRATITGDLEEHSMTGVVAIDDIHDKVSSVDVVVDNVCDHWRDMGIETGSNVRLKARYSDIPLAPTDYGAIQPVTIFKLDIVDSVELNQASLGRGSVVFVETQE